MSDPGLIAKLIQKYRTNKDVSWWIERIGKDTGLTISASSTIDGTSTFDQQTPTSKATAKPVWNDAATTQTQRQDLATQGFTLVDEAAITTDYSTLISKLREGILLLEQDYNLPATFIFLFDEAWNLAWYSQQLFQHACHSKNQFNFDVLAWYIGPGQSGFSPHRDRQPANVLASFHGETSGTDDLTPDPKFVTHWIALSDATPSSSCLYVIPKDSDPGYLNGDDNDEDNNNGTSNDNEQKVGCDPLQRALPDKTAYQKIRALPRQSGQSLLFTHRLIHWGSQSWEIDHQKSRIAISFVCSDPEYEAPFLNHAWKDTDITTSTGNTVLLPFHLRLLLVCAQLICYHERFEPNKTTIKACYDYCKEHENELGETFRQKVFLEFIKAMEEKKRFQATIKTADKEPRVAPSTTSKNSGVNNGDHDGPNDDDDDDDDEDEDAMMEEMLNAEQDGYGEFEDDFDAMDGNENTDNESGGKECGEDDDGDDDEDDVDIFGKRGLEIEDSKISKKVKKALEGSS